MAYGLTATGFVPKDQGVLLTEMDARLRGRFGDQLNLVDGVIFRMSRVFTEPVTELWELGQAIVAAYDPDQSVDTAQDAVCAITGTERDEEVASTVELSLTGADATVVPAGSLARITGTELDFETLTDATITTRDPWAASTAYTLGQRRRNVGNVYQVLTPGTSAGSGGPTGTDPATPITDGSVIWQFLGVGVGAAVVDAAAVVPGPTEALSGTITTIQTAVSGWTGVFNLLDAEVGRLTETNEDLRIRREEELATAGTSPVDAIRADLLRVAGVTSVTVFNNPTDDTDADGVPPHSVECLVRGGEDQDIFDALLAAVAGGIRTYGSEEGTTEDDEGNEHDVAFSRPDEVLIYIDVVGQYDADLYPPNGDDQIKAAIVAYGDAQKTGRNVDPSAVSAQAFKVAGWLRTTTLELGTAPSPSGTTAITITSRQLAVYDTSRITVASTAGTP